MRRKTLIVTGLIVLGIVWAGGFTRDSFQRLVMLTTADPGSLGLVGSTSMKPVAITLHTRRAETVLNAGPYFITTDFTGKTIDEQITFVVPSAYLNVIDLKEGPGGPQRVGFSVWGRTFEPFMPDYIATLRAYSARSSSPTAAPPLDLTRPRFEAGERELAFEVSNYLQPKEAERQRVLDHTSLENPDAPCVRTVLADLNLERVAAPEGVVPSQSCLATPMGFGTIHYRRYNSDGSLKFVAICYGEGLNRSGIRLPPKSCRLNGYFRNWPVTILVRSSAPKVFEPVFNHVQDFLFAHVKI